VIPLLFEADHINEVIAVQNPLTGLADDIANTRAALAHLAEFTARGPTIMVGYSYGGTVVSGAAQDTPADVRALVFVAAVTVDQGEAPEDVFERFPSGLFAFPQHDDRGFLTINRDAFPEVFAQDVDHPRAAVMSVVQKWTSPSCFSDALGVPPAWRSLPSTFLVSEEDRVIDPDAQRMMAERIATFVLVALPVLKPQ
jgi:pimeloyl-ACP methyl ester carboxylesterase